MYVAVNVVLLWFDTSVFLCYELLIEERGKN
jgi:hypothetical protein